MMLCLLESSHFAEHFDTNISCSQKMELCLSVTDPSEVTKTILVLETRVTVMNIHFVILYKMMEW